jgi:FKBP-type peptidyl-prolyl cis-trans isomerase SlyD
MTLQKNDFIEIEFTGKIKRGEIFDSNLKKDIEKAELKTPAKPFIFALGQGMFLKGVDDFLIGKEPNKNYHIELTPENAFGIREPNLIKLIPAQVFKQHKLNPFPGALFNFDGKIAKVLSVSGGRIRVDFNNPLAGKDVEYDIRVLRKVEDTNEKINALNSFLFKKEFKFEIKDKKLILEVEKPLAKFVEMFKEKFKEMFNLELEIKEIKPPVKKE